MNSLVAEYRKRVPNDPRSDDALTLLLGQSNADGRFNGYKDFVDDYTRLSQPEPAEKPPIGAEFRMGVNRGVASLKSSAAGLGALGADVVGADSLRDSLVQKYNDIEQQSSADNPAGVAKIEDIKGAGDAARYALGKAGELVPNVAEAAAFGLAGAAAGTAIEPGGGTAAGGTAGFLEGFLQKQAAKSALKALLEKGDKIIADKAARELVVGQLESIAKREAVSELAPATQALMETEGKALARKYGANAAEVLNFGGLGAGGQFPRAQQTNPEDAKVSALIAGIGGAAGTILPGSIINKLLPGVAEEPAKEYLQRLALNAAQHIPAGVVGMGAMELGNIAAERYADPAKRDQPLSEEELSRIMNAAVVGGMAGAVTAPVTAIRGPRNFDPSVKAHFPDVTEQRMNDIDDAIARQKAGTETAADTSTLRTLNAQEQAYKAVAEEQVQPAPATSSREVATEPSDASNTESPAVVSAAGPANDEQPVAATGPAASSTPLSLMEKQLAKDQWGIPFNTKEELQAYEDSRSRENAEELQRKRAAAAVSVKAEDATVRAAKAKVAAASAQTNPTPTTSQRMAGNYQKGHLAGADVGLPGVTIAIENPVGSERTGMSAEGQPWKVTMPTTYGQILGTKGRDGDPLDIHIGPNPTAEHVYVVDQIDPRTGKFDEHKIMLGFESKVQAEAAYDAGFSDGKGPERRGAVTPMGKPELREWLKDETKTKEALNYAKRIESTEPVHAHGGESGGAKPNEQAAVAEGGEGVRGGGQGTKPEKSAGESGRQPETKPAEAKPSGGKSVAATKEPALAPAAKAPNPEEVADVERRGLGDTSGRGRRGEEAQRVEPAWFRPSGKEDYPELAKRLLSDASPSDQGARNSQTHRLTAIEDKQTGKVHLVSTFENNKEARVTRFTDAVKAPPRAKSISLRGLLTGTFLPKEENKPLQNRFEVLGSVRSKEPTEYQHSVFENRKDFEDRFGKVLDEKQRAMARTMEAVERANVQQTGKPTEEEAGPEPAGEEEVANDEPSVGPEFEHEPEPINLEAHEVKVLADKMPAGTTVDDLADMITAKNVDPDLLAVLKKIAVADPSFFTRVEEVGTLKALKEYGYKIDAGTGKQVERGAGRAEGTGVPNPERGVSAGAGGPAAVVDRGENPPGKTEGGGQPESGTGDNEGNAEPAGAGEEVDAIPDLVSETPETIAAGRRQDVESVMELRRMGYAEVDVRNSDAGQRLIERGEYPKNTIPNGWESVENSPQEEHDRQAEALLNRLHEAAARAGMDVRLFNAKAKGGAYNLKDRRFMQALTDTVGRGDVKTALHEIGHDVFSGEAPEVRDRLLSAIDRLTDESLGVDMSADTRIRSSDPAKLGKPGVNEERLVDATAQKLLEEGFDPAEAKGFAQQFVRTLKDLYYRAAMFMQEVFGHPANPEMARRYFENRVRSLLAGDVKGQSYGDFTGSEKRPRSAIWKEHFDNGRILGERVSPNGRVEYDHVPDLNLAGVRFNLPEPMPNAEYSRKVEVDQVAARLNHLAETVAKAGRAALEDPAVAAEAQRLKLAPDAFARRVLRLQDPAKSKQWLENQREVNGDQVDYDPNKKLEDFRDKANRDQNIRAAYGNVERLWNRAGEGIAEREALITPLEDKLDRYQKRLTKAQSDLESVKELKKDSSTEVRNIDKTIGKFEYKRDSIKRRVLAVERKIERTKIEVAALKKMAPAFEREKTRLGGKIQIGVETTWGNGMPYNVVEKPNATSAEILAKDDDGQVKSARKLKLDSTGAMTDPKEVDEAIRKNTEFLAHREALAAAGDENALDDVYQGIKHQRDEMLANKDYSLRVGTAERLMFGLTISPTGKRLSDGLGTPSARSAERRLNRYETILNTLHPAVEKYGRVSLQLENDLIRLAPELTHETLRQDVIFPAIHIIEQATDLAERYASDPAKRDRAIYQRVREKLLRNDALRSRIGGVIDKFMPLLEKKIRHSYEASQYIHNAVREGAGVKREFGLGVQDKSLKAVNPATGARETASRAPLEVGPYTFSKRFSRMARAMSQALRASGWDGFSDSVDEFAAAQNDEERAAASEELLTYTNHEDFGETVKNDFVKELVTMEHKSPFFAPAEEGEVARVPASPELMQEAFEQSGFAENGDLVALAEAMHEAHGGEGDSAPYVEETLRRFGEFYKDIVSKLSEAEPDPSPSNPTIRGMMAPALIDARSIAHLPGSWLDYHSYDQRDMLNQLMRVSSELAFGRGQEGLATDFETMAKESMGAKARISAALRELQVNSPHASEKEARAFLEKRFGKETYATLKRQAAMDNRITDSIRDLSDYFRKGNSPDGTLRALTRGAHALGMMLVNQPASAIRNMEQIFAGFMKFGVSRETLGATAHAVKEFATEAVNSFTQALGVNLQMESERHQRYVDLGHQDPAIVKKWHDAFDPQQGEGKTTRFFRGLTDVMGQGMNRLGPEGKHTVFRPFQPFTWTAIMQDEALNHLTWDLAERFVRRGIDFYQANPEKLGDLNHKLLPENMGLKGASLDTFKRFHAAMQRWDLSYDDMVRGAMKRADKTLFTDEEAQRLYGLSVSELSSESNIATMPPAAFNNSVLRVISPLLGWPFRRMMDVVSVGRTPEGKHDLATLARGLAGLSVLALGGLGVSALVNQYQENVVGKKPNLRGLLDAPDGKEMALGIFENLSRAGTLGLLGEGINGLVNVGLGGDNRTIFSLDQRVVALSAMASLQQAVSSWVNQGQADYAHVIRPVLGSMGGSGALQYMDIANHVLDLDNPEARYVARINAQNYLRVVGRQLGLEVRASAGGPGGYSPTPLSPALTRMELAAYKNNAADFQEAYYEAVQKAKEAGYEDPVGHIKQSFSARNPLRTVFAVSPTKGDYNRILATLPDGGRHDVEEAVTLFNKYVESIGGREFEGKAEKKEPDFTKGQRFTMPAFGSGGRPLTSDRAVSAVFSR